mmetsp:Transcript_21289/g.27200  ORF Transcript_21289/g.27200 Transcript_21289/m.27200 type:complete len:381 (+) Transcript_21289:147-1289(+)
MENHFPRRTHAVSPFLREITFKSRNVVSSWCTCCCSCCCMCCSKMKTFCYGNIGAICFILLFLFVAVINYDIIDLPKYKFFVGGAGGHRTGTLETVYLQRPGPVAIVTLHMGRFYDTKEGENATNCLRERKKEYAKMYGLKYFDEEYFKSLGEEGLIPYRDWMVEVPRKKGKFNKLRYILHLLHKYQYSNEVHWLMWVDADAMFADYNISIYRKLDTFINIYSAYRQQHTLLDRLSFRLRSPKKDKTNLKEPLMILAKRRNRWMWWENEFRQIKRFVDDWNDGVFFIRASPEGYAFARKWYDTFVHPYDYFWADQKALELLLKGNSEAMSQTLLLPQTMLSMIQEFWYIKNNTWVVHFPGKPSEEKINMIRNTGLCPAYF